MRKITRQLLANGASEHFRAQYRDDGMIYPDGFNSEPRSIADIKNKLDALGPRKNPDDVDRIIGNKGWTSVPTCDECGRGTDCVIEIGQEPGYDSSTANVCLECLAKALKLGQDG